MADSTLEAVQTKVRRLTRSPSENQLTTVQINEYINTFLLYDLPSQLRLFNLRKTLTFYTSPNVAEYSTTNTVVTDPLYNFKNRYITIDQPVYIGGYQASFTQSRSQFYSVWNIFTQQQLVGLGNGTQTEFSNSPSLGIQLTGPLLPNNITFSAISADNVNGIGAPNLPLVMKDIPVVDVATGRPTSIGNLYAPNTEPATPPTLVIPTNNINYLTGAFTVTFPSAPTANATQNQIFIEAVPYQATRPTSMLYYDDVFTVRPVPDISYPVNIEVNMRPIELLTGESPQLEQWWQYIAYGAAKKVFEDRTDSDSVQDLMPEFKQQELFVLRTTLVQQATQRAATIYSNGMQWNGKNNWFNGF